QLAYMDQARAAADSVTTLVGRLPRSEGLILKSIEKFSALWPPYLKIRDQVIAAILVGQYKEALDLHFSEALPVFDKAKTALTDLQHELNTSADRRSRSLTNSLYRTMIEVGILLVGILFFLRTLSVNEARLRTLKELQPITAELKDTQRHLLERELRLQALFENINDAIITIDERGVMEHANPATEWIFGYEISELTGKNVSMLMPSPHQEKHDGYLRSYHETGIGKVIGIGRLVRGRRKDGTEFPLELSVSEVNTADRRTFVGICRDITERRKAEEELEHGRRLLMDVTANIPGAVFQMKRLHDDKSAFLFISDGAKELFGKSAAEMMGNSELLTECIHPDDVEGLTRVFQIATRAEIPFEHTYRVRRRGEVRWLAISAAPQMQGSGDIIWNGLIVDVTPAKETEEKLAAYAEELLQTASKAETATRAKSEFLATMSHEIRTPMNGVIGMTGLLLETQLTGEQRDHAETIRASGEALLSIINDILDFSKIEAGKLDLEYCPFDPRLIVEESVEVVASLASQKDIELCAPVDDGVPSRLIGDPARLRQILLNLLSNAIKFTEAGEVVLSVHSSPVGEGSALVMFEIKDSGIGISPEIQAKLFQSFTQADSSTTRRFGGTGLGLTICKRLVELMGGEIGVRSEAGAGSTFWFTVPLRTTTESIALPCHRP
ncbi:MAG: PAS domain S-box protein, partial [Bryobacteraceae bacterium]